MSQYIDFDDDDDVHVRLPLTSSIPFSSLTKKNILVEFFLYNK